MRAIVSQADNNVPLFDVRTQVEQIEQTLYQERLMSRLSSFFGLLALTLTRIGLYGLLSYEVARRTRELGIRMALGAQRRELLRLVVRRGLVLAMAGAIIGIAAAMLVTGSMASMLYSVRPYDPATFAGVCIVLVLVALAACSIPARRATRIDPMVAALRIRMGSRAKTPGALSTFPQRLRPPVLAISTDGLKAVPFKGPSSIRVSSTVNWRWNGPGDGLRDPYIQSSRCGFQIGETIEAIRRITNRLRLVRRNLKNHAGAVTSSNDRGTVYVSLCVENQRTDRVRSVTGSREVVQVGIGPAVAGVSQLEE